MGKPPFDSVRVVSPPAVSTASVEFQQAYEWGKRPVRMVTSRAGPRNADKPSTRTPSWRSGRRFSHQPPPSPRMLPDSPGCRRNLTSSGVPSLDFI